MNLTNKKIYKLRLNIQMTLYYVLQAKLLYSDFSEMYSSDSICDIKQYILHTYICVMDDVTISCKSISASSVLANRRPIFSLVVGNGINVDLVSRLRQ